MNSFKSQNKTGQVTRRQFLRRLGLGAGLAITGGYAWKRWAPSQFPRMPVFIAKAASYNSSLSNVLLEGLSQLGVNQDQITGKRVLLKPNLVEPHPTSAHINTHPMVVAAAIEAFKTLGASEVFVAEGSGHRMDTMLILEMTGYQAMLNQQRTSFSDLNRSEVFLKNNLGTFSNIRHWLLPIELKKADFIVSMAKLKTHHWVGATLSMKNLFGIMPGAHYGWPKNVLHMAGIENCILDINATVQPHLAIVDGIVGMEGDGPIMGEPVNSNVLVIGRSMPAVDATCARIMGINPEKIGYLSVANKILGPIKESQIEQRGEPIQAMKKNFVLLDKIPSHRGLRI